MPTVGMFCDASAIRRCRSVVHKAVPWLRNNIPKFLSTASLMKMSLYRVHIQEAKALSIPGHLGLAAAPVTCEVRKTLLVASTSSVASSNAKAKTISGDFQLSSYWWCHARGDSYVASVQLWHLENNELCSVTLEVLFWAGTEKRRVRCNWTH